MPPAHSGGSPQRPSTPQSSERRSTSNQADGVGIVEAHKALQQQNSSLQPGSFKLATMNIRSAALPTEILPDQQVT